MLLKDKPTQPVVSREYLSVFKVLVRHAPLVNVPADVFCGFSSTYITLSLIIDVAINEVAVVSAVVVSTLKWVVPELFVILNFSVSFVPIIVFVLWWVELH